MQTTWLDTEEYPFRHHYFQIHGHRLHYIDEGKGETILFVHGTPSWSFEARNVIRLLSREYRCIAIDHMGFGLSDKPAGYDYSVLNHSMTLKTFILENDLHDITLVVHDFGGPIGLYFALCHTGRIRRLIIMNSWMWNCATDPGFIRFSRVLKSPLLPFLYKYLNFSARFLMPAAFGDTKLSRHILRHFTAPFEKPSHRLGTVAFAKSLLSDQEWFGQLWEQKEKLLNKPVLFIWGMKDRFTTPAYLDTFISGFPEARVVRLEHCGHFPLEEAYARVASEIQVFMTETPARSVAD